MTESKIIVGIWLFILSFILMGCDPVGVESEIQILQEKGLIDPVCPAGQNLVWAACDENGDLLDFHCEPISPRIVCSPDHHPYCQGYGNE